MPSNYIITSPSTYPEKLALQSLFIKRIPILIEAEPYTSTNSSLIKQWSSLKNDTLLFQIKNSDNDLIAGISSGSPTVHILHRTGHAPKPIDYTNNAREIDYLAVDTGYENKGIASKLLMKVEAIRRGQGYNFLYGSVWDKENKDSMSDFYTNREYEVVDKLPSFLGLNRDNQKDESEFYFYKFLNK